MTIALETQGLEKQFGGLRVTRDLSLRVEHGAPAGWAPGLRARGYQVIDAPTGALALRQAELSRAPVRLVLADATTRGSDGEEVLTRLRRSGHPATVLFVSGGTDRSIAQLGLDRQPLLRKVFSPEQLARRVRETLDAPHATAGRRL